MIVVVAVIVVSLVVGVYVGIATVNARNWIYSYSGYGLLESPCECGIEPPALRSPAVIITVTLIQKYILTMKIQLNK